MEKGYFKVKGIKILQKSHLIGYFLFTPVCQIRFLPVPDLLLPPLRAAAL
jgi:phage antirepressor YoqD-like protein